MPEKLGYSRKELYSTGEGEYREGQLPTQSVDQLSEVNLAGKSSDASGTVEVVAGTATVRSVLTYIDFQSGTASTDSAWFETKIADTTVRNDFGGGEGSNDYSTGFRDGGLGVVPAGSAIVVNAYPAGTVTVSSNVRLIPLE